jgi:3-oxoadipate enol-lactonase
MSSDQYFLTDGARLRYRDEGAGPAIVLLHGWTLDLEMWDPQAEGLQANFRVIRFDRRGFGLSSGSPDLLHDANDIVALCRHLGTGRVGCIGMSQSTRVVLSLARLHPQLLGCLVLDGPPNLTAAAPSGPDDLDYTALRAVARNEGLEAFRHEWRRHALTALETADPATHQLLERMIARYRGWDLLSEERTPNQATIDFALAEIRQPALVLNGALDSPARLRAGEALAQALPRAQRAIVPRSRHLANLDNPTEYNSLLVRFFSVSF